MLGHHPLRSKGSSERSHTRVEGRVDSTACAIDHDTTWAWQKQRPGTGKAWSTTGLDCVSLWAGSQPFPITALGTGVHTRDTC